MEAPDQPPTLEELIEWCHRPMRCADVPSEWARMWLGSALENHDGLGAIAALRDLGWSAEHIADDPSRVPYPWCRALVEQVHRMVAADLGIPYPEPPDEDIEWLVEGCDYVDPESFFMIRSAVLMMARLCSGERATELVRHLHD